MAGSGRGRSRLRVVDTSDDNPTGDARPIVQIIAGKRSEAIDAAEEHLIERDAGLWQRGDFVVRVAPQEVEIGGGRKAQALRIARVGMQHMRNRFNLAVDLRKFDRRTETWLSVDCPNDFADAYLERAGLWKLPVLTAVTTAPGLRPNGTLIDRPGFDPATGVYFEPRGVQFPAVPAAPDRAAALAALDHLDELIGGVRACGRLPAWLLSGSGKTRRSSSRFATPCWWRPDCAPCRRVALMR